MKSTKKTRAYRKWHSVCEACLIEKNELEVAHIKTEKSGGTDNPENLLVLGPECHYGIVHTLGFGELIRRYPWNSSIRNKILKMKPKLKV